ncbi:hypothetical protein AM233_18590 [Bacillus sp. FJAT-22058]|nr:hypothetical protein AM233_18590 [Bacillus sp. FJAT-22058]
MMISLAGILGEAGDLVGSLTGMRSFVMQDYISLRQALGSGKAKLFFPNVEDHACALPLPCDHESVMNNPEFKALHSNNVKVKKIKRMKSIMKLCGKLARVLVGIARNGSAYKPEMVLPLEQLAA